MRTVRIEAKHGSDDVWTSNGRLLAEITTPGLPLQLSFTIKDDFFPKATYRTGEALPWRGPLMLTLITICAALHIGGQSGKVPPSAPTSPHWRLTYLVAAIKGCDLSSGKLESEPQRIHRLLRLARESTPQQVESLESQILA